MAGLFGGYLNVPGGGAGGTAGSGSPLIGSAAELLTDGTFSAAEMISGGRAVAFNQSGALVQAMASVSGRMPAVGVAASNYLSGAAVTLYRAGRLFSTLYNFSGWPDMPLYVGASGDVVASGAPTLSGNVQQIVGVSINASGMMIQIGDPLEGVQAGSGDVGSGAVFGAFGPDRTIASGTVGGNDMGSGAINSGHTASGSVATYARNLFFDILPAQQTLSGTLAVALSSGGSALVTAERQSGLRLPAIGITIENVVSGANCRFVRFGIIPVAHSGGFASGFPGQWLYVGSGGLLVNQSGFMGGGSSGAPTLSGSLVQRVALAMSGQIMVSIGGEPTSGLLSGLLGQF